MMTAIITSTFIHTKAQGIQTVAALILYGCETWFLTLIEECNLRGFENIVLRIIFRPKEGEVSKQFKILQNEELRNL
jgi:hypothetical protein